MRRTLFTGALVMAATVVPAATAAAQDVNHDGIPDRWERAYHLSLRVDQSNRDQDHDGLTNRFEWRDHTSPRKRDTDGNGVPDPQEDANHDGVPNVTEQHDTTAHPDGSRGNASGGGTAHHEPPAPPRDGHTAAGHVVSYTQSSGFGGVLVLERSNGERVSAYFGEKTDLECASAGSAFAPCTKDHLTAGTPVAAAEHGVNAHGADVWTKVLLRNGESGSQQPPPPGPAPAPHPEGGEHGSSTPPAHHAVGGTIVSYEQSPYFGGTLTIQRPNGEVVSAWYGDGTDLRCAPAADAEYAPCTKAQLQRGVVATDARHAANAGGHHAWTRLYLVVPGFSG